MTLHVQARAFLDSLSEQNPPSWQELGPETAREAFAGLPVFGMGPEMESVDDHTVDGEIPIRVYRATKASNPPVIMLFHGGGWVLGSIATHDTLARRIAKLTEYAVVSVDYGLAPENPFPGPLDQCYRATEFVAQQGDDLDLDGTSISLLGDSAGGNLAAAVAIRSRDRLGFVVSAQVLLYPVVSPSFDTGSYSEFAEGYGLTRESMRWFWSCYMDGYSDWKQPLADLYQHQLDGLPPTMVLTCQYDVLRDEGEAFADRLESAGVEVTREQQPGMLHGFVHFSDLFEDSGPAIQRVAEFLKRF